MGFQRTLPPCGTVLLYSGKPAGSERKFSAGLMLIAYVSCVLMSRELGSDKMTFAPK